MLRRSLEGRLRAAWANLPIVVLEGPRSVGKTVLATQLVGRENLRQLDDLAVRRLAERSLRAWMESIPIGGGIDEAQLIAGIPLEAKRLADAQGTKGGRLLLTGSHRISRSDLGGSDPLAGRARRLTLLPFSQSELSGNPTDVMSALFNDPREWKIPSLAQSDLRRRLVSGGFPRAQSIESTHLYDWYRDYADSVLGGMTSGRDVSRLRRFLRWLAAASGQSQNVTQFGKANELTRPTVETYLDELREMHLVSDVENLADAAKRQTRTRRLYVIDSAFVAAELGMANRSGMILDNKGLAVETFAVCEVHRLLQGSALRGEVRWWRSGNDEVDIVIEADDGRLVGIEVKSSRELHTGYGSGLRALRAAYPERFHRGYILYSGDESMAIDEAVWALPMSLLWSVGTELKVEHSSAETLPKSVELAEATTKILAGSLTPEIAAVAQRFALAALGQLSDSLGTLVSDLEQELVARTTADKSGVTLVVTNSAKTRLEVFLALEPLQNQLRWSAQVTTGGRVLDVASWATTIDRTSDQLVHQQAMLAFLAHFATWLPEMTGRL